MFREDPQRLRDDLVNPFWVEDRDLGAGGIGAMPKEEMDFWTNLIDTYLRPLKQSAEEKTKMEFELKNLRNKVCLFFFLSNCLFVTLIFILESVSEYTPSLTFQLPCDKEGAIPAKLEPIAIAFTIIFGILLFIQFLAMLMHRYSTLLHIVSHTKVRFKGKDAQQRRKQDFMNLLEDMQKTEHDYDTDSIRSSTYSDYGETSSVGTFKAHQRNSLMRQLTIKREVKEGPGMDLQGVFEKRFKLLGDALEEVECEEDLARKPVVRNFATKSLFSLVKMDKHEKQRIIDRSRKNWNKLRDEYPLPKPLMSIPPKMAGWVEMAMKMNQEQKQTEGDSTSNQASGSIDIKDNSLWSKPRDNTEHIDDNSKREVGKNVSIGNTKTRWGVVRRQVNSMQESDGTEQEMTSRSKSGMKMSQLDTEFETRSSSESVGSSSNPGDGNGEDNELVGVTIDDTRF